MSQLIDMEDLLNKVKNRELIPNLREAISCYYSSSYRACIILSFNALVDDLIIKLKYSKDVNNDSKRIYNDISKLIDTQAPFENQLIEQLVQAKIFTELDGELYKVFQKFRHKSAHPSGFTPTAECARFIFSEIIVTFLSKDALQSTSRIDKLMSDIAEKHFFVGTDIDEMGKTVESEIKDIHPDALPQLVNRAYKKLINPDEKSRLSYQTFLFALSTIDNLHISNIIINYVVKPNISKSSHEALFTGLVTSNCKVFNGVDEYLSGKIIFHIKERIKKSPENIANFATTNPYNCLLQIYNDCSGHLADKALELAGEFIENPKRLSVFLINIDKSMESKGHVGYLRVYTLLMEELSGDNSNSVDDLINSFISDDLQCLSGIAVFRKLDILLAIFINTSNSEVAKSVINDRFEQLQYLVDGIRPYYLAGKLNASALINSISKEQKAQLNSIIGAMDPSTEMAE